jgi:hypothetical protein
MWREPLGVSADIHVDISLNRGRQRRSLFQNRDRQLVAHGLERTGRSCRCARFDISRAAANFSSPAKAQSHARQLNRERAVLQIPLQKATNVIPVDKLERRFAQRVMPARQDHRFMIQPQLPRLFDHLLGESHREGGVVARINEQ